MVWNHESRRWPFQWRCTQTTPVPAGICSASLERKLAAAAGDGGWRQLRRRRRPHLRRLTDCQHYAPDDSQRVDHRLRRHA
jgi:hypothetical protein